jgi:hypothetical protein
MPSLTIAPAGLKITGAAAGFFAKLDIEPQILRQIGGNIVMGATLSSGLSAKNVRLDRILRTEETAGVKFQALWQRTVQSIETAFKEDQTQIDTLNVIVAQLQAVINAQAATSAQVSAIDADIDLANSKTDPIDGILTATSAGVINISAHSRIYAGGASVTVNAGSISGFSEGSFIRVYYNDSARLGGAVSYQGTTDEVTQTGSVHVVGGVSIPLVGAAPVTGVGTTPPGYVREDER